MFARLLIVSTTMIAAALVCAHAAPARGLIRQPLPPSPAQIMDPMASIYENTVVITNARNKTERLWLSANHTFMWEGPQGQRGKGRWQLTANNSRICLTPTRTPETANEPAATRCAEFAGGHRAGERWVQRNDANEQITVELRKGQ